MTKLYNQETGDCCDVPEKQEASFRAAGWAEDEPKTESADKPATASKPATAGKGK